MEAFLALGLEEALLDPKEGEVPGLEGNLVHLEGLGDRQILEVRLVHLENLDWKIRIVQKLYYIVSVKGALDKCNIIPNFPYETRFYDVMGLSAFSSLPLVGFCWTVDG